jgi:acetyl esterase/lipase
MFRFQFRALIAFVFCALNNAMASPVSFSEVLDLSVEADRVLLPYGAQNQQTLVHFPVGATDADSVLVIHGGCWSNAYGVDHALPMAAALSEQGLDVWAAEYRRVGDEGGGWSGSLEDVKSAARSVTQITGKAPLLVSHSAGGHLALKAAEDPDLSISGVVALAPITDLVSYGAETGSCQSMVPKFMGDDSYSPSDAYREASVRIEDITVPIKVVIGDADPIVGINQVERFTSEQLRTIADAGHFDLIHPETRAFEVVKSMVEQLLKETIQARTEARDE